MAAVRIPGSFSQSMAEAGLAGPAPKGKSSSSASSPNGRTSPSTALGIAPDTESAKASKVLQNSLFGFTGTVKASAGKRRKKTKRVVKKRRNRK
jgi:hypothetical protein